LLRLGSPEPGAASAGRDDCCDVHLGLFGYQRSAIS
jgi:hypothetical protein